MGCCLLAAALLVPSLAIATTPSQDQYTFNLPTPHGQKPTGGQQPTSHPNDLSPAQRQAASGPSGSQLKQIATSPQLGAPSTGNGGGGSGGGGGTGGTGGNSAPGDHGQAGQGAGGKAVEGTRKVNLAGNSPTGPAAAVDAAGGGPVIGLLAAIVAITIGAAIIFLIRRRRAAP
jgi:hypothetical protein